MFEVHTVTVITKVRGWRLEVRSSRLRDVPVDSFLEALGEGGFGFKAEFLVCPGGVEHATRLAVGFGCVPEDATFKIH